MLKFALPLLWVAIAVVTATKWREDGPGLFIGNRAVLGHGLASLSLAILIGVLVPALRIPVAFAGTALFFAAGISSSIRNNAWKTWEYSPMKRWERVLVVWSGGLLGASFYFLAPE